MSHTARKVTRLHFNDGPSDIHREPECGCPMCRLQRVKRENHTLSYGVYHEQWQSQRVSDKSPRASLLRLVEKGDVSAENVFAEINRRNAEFWKKRGGMPE